jgi:hypothetical protein
MAMSTATLKRRLENLERTSQPPTVNPTLEQIRRDPANIMRLAGLEPDPWQVQLLRSASPRISLCCSRQAGKTASTSSLALKEALLNDSSLVLILSPSLRQSQESFRAVMNSYRALGCPLPTAQESALRVEFVNGSRIIALPGTESNIRGFSKVSLLVVDEAARVSDSLFYAIRPMLAVSSGRMIVLSTPFGKTGWFYTAWTGPEAWERISITADKCPRITREFLDEERRVLGPRWFGQEYACEFSDPVGAVFLEADIRAALSSEIEPLFRA